MPAAVDPTRRPRSVRRRLVILVASTFVVMSTAAASCAPTGTGGGSPTTTTKPKSTTTTVPKTTTTVKPTTTTAAPTTTTTPASSTVDLTKLPLGDKKYSSTPKVGYIDTCQSSFSGGGAGAKGPWFNSDGTTWNSTSKETVSGSVHWTSQFSMQVVGDQREVTMNDLPSTPTGTFPISSSDPVWQYDKNPNSIQSQDYSFSVPANPTVASTPTCIHGEVGFVLVGAALFDGFDAGGRDAAAWEAQDACGGHPMQSGGYHFHNLSPCLSDPGTGQSALLGYALDGFGIYGPRGADGKELTDADLDACHGITSAVPWNGKTVVMYHYVFTREFPYSVGCFRGTPEVTGITNPQ